MRVKHNGRNVKVEVSSDGEGLVSHAGSPLLSGLADATGLTAALSRALMPLYDRRPKHDPGGVVRDLAVMLAGGGDCLSDLAGVRDQAALFGPVASDSTAFRLVDRIASEPGGLALLEAAHAAGRVRAWELLGAPQRLTIDVDATLLTAHSEQEGTAGNYKGGFGFHPMLAYGDETGEALGGILRPGNAGANTAADQIAAAEQAVGQIPAEHAARVDMLLRVDTAGASTGSWTGRGRDRSGSRSGMTSPLP